MSPRRKRRLVRVSPLCDIGGEWVSDLTRPQEDQSILTLSDGHRTRPRAAAAITIVWRHQTIRRNGGWLLLGLYQVFVLGVILV